jgi:hypothetical protein
MHRFAADADTGDQREHDEICELVRTRRRMDDGHGDISFDASSLGDAAEPDGVSGLPRMEWLPYPRGVGPFGRAAIQGDGVLRVRNFVGNAYCADCRWRPMPSWNALFLLRILMLSFCAWPSCALPRQGVRG